MTPYLADRYQHSSPSGIWNDQHDPDYGPLVCGRVSEPVEAQIILNFEWTTRYAWEQRAYAETIPAPKYGLPYLRSCRVATSMVCLHSDLDWASSRWQSHGGGMWSRTEKHSPAPWVIRSIRRAA